MGVAGSLSAREEPVSKGQARGRCRERGYMSIFSGQQEARSQLGVRTGHGCGGLGRGEGKVWTTCLGGWEGGHMERRSLAAGSAEGPFQTQRHEFKGRPVPRAVGFPWSATGLQAQRTQTGPPRFGQVLRGGWELRVCGCDSGSLNPVELELGETEETS